MVKSLRLVVFSLVAFIPLANAVEGKDLDSNIVEAVDDSAFYRCSIALTPTRSSIDSQGLLALEALGQKHGYKAKFLSREETPSGPAYNLLLLGGRIDLLQDGVMGGPTFRQIFKDRASRPKPPAFLDVQDDLLQVSRKKDVPLYFFLQQEPVHIVLNLSELEESSFPEEYQRLLDGLESRAHDVFTRDEWAFHRGPLIFIIDVRLLETFTEFLLKHGFEK